MAESKEELKSLLRVKEESEKAGLKLSIQKRSWHPVPSFHGKYMGHQWKQWQTLFSWAPKSLQDGDCSHKIQGHLLLGWKAITNIDKCIKKERHHFANKGPSSRSYGFSSSRVWMWELDHKEGCTLKNWCFPIVMLEKTFEGPFNCKEIKPILKKINPEYSLEGLMLKLELQYFGHLMGRADSLQKTLMLGETKSRRRRGQ